MSEATEAVAGVSESLTDAEAAVATLLEHGVPALAGVHRWARPAQ